MVGDEAGTRFLDEPVHGPEQHVGAQHGGDRFHDARIVNQIPGPGMGDGQPLPRGPFGTRLGTGFGFLQTVAQFPGLLGRECAEREQKAVPVECADLCLGQCRHGFCPRPYGLPQPIPSEAVVMGRYSQPIQPS